MLAGRSVLSSKRLAPMLEVLVPMLRRDGEVVLSDDEADLLVAMSPATIDRRLRNAKAVAGFIGRSHTKPGSLLKSQIPIRTWSEWDENQPGFVEIDLVGHEGGNSFGEFCFTLTITDVATGWTVTDRGDPRRQIPAHTVRHERGAALRIGDTRRSTEAIRRLCGNDTGAIGDRRDPADRVEPDRSQGGAGGRRHRLTPDTTNCVPPAAAVVTPLPSTIVTVLPEPEIIALSQPQTTPGRTHWSVPSSKATAVSCHNRPKRGPPQPPPSPVGYSDVRLLQREDWAPATRPVIRWNEAHLQRI